SPPPVRLSQPSAAPLFAPATPTAAPGSGWSLPAAPTPSTYPSFKAPASISFGTPILTTSPSSSPSGSGGGPTRGSASRNSRNHPGAVPLRAQPNVKPTSPSTFDWGVLPQAKTVHVSNFVPFGSPSTPTASRPYFSTTPQSTPQGTNGKDTTPEEEDGEFDDDEEEEGDEDESFTESGDGRYDETGDWPDEEALDTISERDEEE
ncbi:hypothetical protein P7C70_g5258, partial [Phenoliferia sp. Uapishka_3]